MRHDDKFGLKDMTRRVWLPFTDAAEAAAALGPLPDGIQADYFLADGTWPDSIDEVELIVPPYLLPPEVSLSRIDEMTGLTVIQLLTAGFEDFVPYLRPGLQLCNAAGVHDASTAELAVALALASCRRLDRFARNMSTGAWRAEFTESLADRRVLIIGYGHIGQAIEQRLAGFEVASVVRVARTARQGAVDVRQIGELHALLPQSDVVFVATPLNPETTGLIGEFELGLLPEGALLVNVARGKVIDTEALVKATGSGRIRAALDVTEPEPLPRDHPLWRTPGVLISPHTGGQSSAFYPRMHRLLRGQLAKFAARESLENVVA